MTDVHKTRDMHTKKHQTGVNRSTCVVCVLDDSFCGTFAVLSLRISTAGHVLESNCKLAFCHLQLSTSRRTGLSVYVM